MDNLGLNILLAENFYKAQVITRSALPKNRVKYFYNIKIAEIEKPLPNFIKETKNLLHDILKAGYNVSIEKHGYLYRTIINDHEVIDDFERSIAIALLLNILR